MPPRYSYWTIIADGLPTAFRAAEKEELLPTFARIKHAHPDAHMKWFARGKLWESPESARLDAQQRRQKSVKPADRDWRPGGRHQDPHQRYKDAKKARNAEHRRKKFERRQRFAGKSKRAGEPPASPRPERPPRQPRPGERVEPTPPPRPSEPVISPPGPPVRGRRGRPRRRPDKLHADKGYDHRFCRRACRARGIIPRIARRGIEDSTRLGRHRWKVERTLAWMARFRRLAVRYERRADIHLAFTTLAAAIICISQIARFG